MPDESVYAEVEGDEKKVDLFIQWCKVGSPLSKVESISLSDLKLKGESSFEILR
jgi:acylphosphatase